MSSKMKRLTSNIDVDKEVMGGVPVLKGTRITIASLLSDLEDLSFNQIIDDRDLDDTSSFRFKEIFICMLELFNNPFFIELIDDPESIGEQIKRIYKIVEVEYSKFDKDVFDHVSSSAEELGEFVQAIRVEKGLKNKELTEPAKNEAIDLIICGFALFYGSEGNLNEIAKIMREKLDKWEKNLNERK